MRRIVAKGWVDGEFKIFLRRRQHLQNFEGYGEEEFGVEADQEDADFETAEAKRDEILSSR